MTGRTDRRARVSDWFACIDTDGNGRLEWDDLRRVVDAIASYVGWLPESPLFTRLLEGQRAFWESLSACSGPSDDDAISLEAFQHLFATLADDVDRSDGRVPAWALGHVMALLRALDLDGDGTITLDEYALYLQCIASTADAVEAFKRLDVDGDGRLTLDELESRYVEWLTSDDPNAPGVLLATGRQP